MDQILELIKLLRDYITTAEYEELLKRLVALIADPAARIALIEFLRELLAKYINGPNGQAVKGLVDRIIASLPRAAAPPAPSLLRLGIRIGVYAALAYLIIAALYDRKITQKPIGGGKGPCAIRAGVRPLHVDPSAVGPNAALRDALDELERQCTNLNLTCRDTACATCGPDVAVQTVNIKNRIFFYTADVNANCQCGCK